jgi:hypothetical protein
MDRDEDPVVSITASVADKEKQGSQKAMANRRLVTKSDFLR